MTGLDPNTLDRKYYGSTIYKKAVLLLGRLERRIPNISLYIAALNHASRFLPQKDNTPKSAPVPAAE